MAHRTSSPSLLSLFCRELNEERKRRGQPQFDEQLIEDAKRDVLSNYYASCVHELPPRVADFIETELITENGFPQQLRPRGRGAVASDRGRTHPTDRQATAHGSRNTTAQQRIELTHDVLTDVVREHRDRRREEDEKATVAARAAQERQAVEQAAAQRVAEVDRERRVERQRRLESEARAARRFRWLSAVLAFVSVVAVVLAAVAIKTHGRPRPRRNDAIAERLYGESQLMLAGQSPLGSDDYAIVQRMLAAHAIQSTSRAASI